MADPAALVLTAGGLDYKRALAGRRKPRGSRSENTARRVARFASAVRALDEVRLAGIDQVSVETIVAAPGS